MSQPGYLPQDVVILTGIPYSTLNLWAKEGFIRPSVREASGTGKCRIYSESDLALLRIAKLLRECGLEFRIIEKAIKKFSDYPKSKRIELQLSTIPDVYISIRRPT